MSRPLPWLKQLFREFWDDNPFVLSAALSYYTLFSLAPLILVVTALAGLVFGREAVEGQIVAEMRNLVGEAGAEVIQGILRSAADSGAGKLSLGVGLVTLLFGATTVFVQLQSALNAIWDVKADPKKSKIADFVKTRLLSFALIVGLGFLLLVSLMLSAGLSALGAWAEGRMPLTPLVWQGLNLLVSLVLFTLMIGAVFKVLPDVELSWREVGSGALLTAVLLTLGKFLIGIYLGHASVGSAYGAAGSVVVLLVWVYYAILILLLGAEITRVRTLRTSGDAPPTEHAVPAAR